MIDQAIQKLLDIAAKPAEVVEVNGRTVILKKDGSVVDPENYLPNPYRKKADEQFISTESFCAYVNDHKTPATHLFGSVERGTFRAEIDYHERGAKGNGQWRDHFAQLALPRSPDWDKWASHCGPGMSQTTLAEFLEEMDHTIVEPEGAAIIEIVEKLKLTSDRRFASSVNRATGAMSFEYAEDTQQTKGVMKLPEKILVHIAPWRFADYVDLVVFLRYRLSEGKLSFFMKMDRPDRVTDAAFASVVKKIEESIGLPVLMQ